MFVRCGNEIYHNENCSKEGRKIVIPVPPKSILKERNVTEGFTLVNSNILTIRTQNPLEFFFLVGNSFPYHLIGRPCLVYPLFFEVAKKILQGNSLCSFYGHSEMLKGIKNIFGVDLSPENDPRPTVSLDGIGYPTMNGRSFKRVLLIATKSENNYPFPKIVEVTCSMLEF